MATVTHFLTSMSYTTAQEDSTTNSQDSEKYTDSEIEELLSLGTRIRLILFPFIICLGVFGNLMTIVIVLRLRANSSRLDNYFLCLACSDLCMIGAGPARLWVRHKWPSIDIRTVHDIPCKLQNFVFNVAAAVSAWLVVAMVVQRALSVTWPHRVGLMCTARRRWAAIASIVIFMCLAYSHFFYGMVLTGGQCIFRPGYFEFLINVFVKIDVFLFSVIPLAVVAISNIVLVRKLRASVKEVGEQLAASDKQQTEREKKVNSITLTALLVSVCFILFTLPIAVWNALDHVSINIKPLSRHETIFRYFVQSQLYNVFYSNFSVNFYVYCLTGQRFRNEFKNVMWGLVRCIKCSRT